MHLLTKIVLFGFATASSASVISIRQSASSSAPPSDHMCDVRLGTAMNSANILNDCNTARQKMPDGPVPMPYVARGGNDPSLRVPITYSSGDCSITITLANNTKKETVSRDNLKATAGTIIDQCSTSQGQGGFLETGNSVSIFVLVYQTSLDGLGAGSGTTLTNTTPDPACALQIAEQVVGTSHALLSSTSDCSLGGIIVR